MGDTKKCNQPRLRRLPVEMPGVTFCYSEVCSGYQQFCLVCDVKTEETHMFSGLSIIVPDILTRCQFSTVEKGLRAMKDKKDTFEKCLGPTAVTQ